MSSELSLVIQLALILVSAGVFTVIFKALKQPLILGYIVAGFIVGPHLGLFPQFSPESVHEWSELGIIFLLFGLGLEFNFKKLLNVGGTAMISALTICVGMFLTGSLVGSLMKWSVMESMFLGGMMSMSSTTIIIKAYDDLGIKNKPYATVVFGLLVVEDLLAVLMMVLFSTLAVSRQFSGIDMLLSLVKLVAFLVLCFLVGIYLLPSLFKKGSRFISDEIILLISVGLCLLMVVLANVAGFSSALGAFLMGSILSSTIEGERVEHITGNIKNLFGAIFFVSVGMMVDPDVISQYWPTILIITFTAMLGILIFSTSGVLIAGKSLDTALHVGFSLPQLGEFSFIIAGLGCTLGVLRDFIYPVIISVSVITTFTTPYMIKASDPVSRWLHANLPERLVARLNSRSKSSSHMSVAEGNTWKTFVKKYMLRTGVYGMILVVLLLGMREYFPILADKMFPGVSGVWRNVLLTSAALMIMSPFLYGLAINRGSLKKMSEDLVRKDSRSRIPLTVAIFFSIFLAVGFVISTLMVFAKLSTWMYLVIAASLVVIFFLTRRQSQNYSMLENRFLTNLKEKDEYNRKKAPVTTMMREKFTGYDVHIKAVPVSSDFSYAGKTLREMPFRHNSGINVVKIQRGSQSILIPRGDEPVFPGDVLLAVGTNEQIEAFEKNMSMYSRSSVPVTEEFTVDCVRVSETSVLNGQALKDTDMRANGCMVVSVERNGDIHTNPDKDFQFCEGDLIWMAGLKSSVKWYES